MLPVDGKLVILLGKVDLIRHFLVSIMISCLCFMYTVLDLLLKVLLSI